MKNAKEMAKEIFGARVVQAAPLTVASLRHTVAEAAAIAARWGSRDRA